MIDLSQFPMCKKPYSDGTLKQWSKSELIEYIRLIEGNYKTLYQVYIQSVKNAEGLLGRKRGRWIRVPLACYGGGTVTEYGCSECHETQIAQSDFCPNCGADMRG